MRARIDLSLTLLLLAACGKPTEVELRLAPCGSPVRVDLDIQGYDADGGALTALHASFAIADTGVFGDGYATVGLRKPAGMVTADFTLTWHGDGDAAEVVTLTGVAVPAVGEVLELGANGCAPVGGDSSTTEPTTGAASTSSGSSTGTTTTAATTSTTTSGASTTSTTSTESTGETTTTGESTSTTTEDTTTGDVSIVGTPCLPVMDSFYCENGGPGQVGDLIKCDSMSLTWKQVDPSECDVNTFCTGIPGLDFPQGVGCSGIANEFVCLCQETPAEPCDGNEVACGDPDMSVVTLCVDDGMGANIRTQGYCGTCDDSVADAPYCAP